MESMTGQLLVATPTLKDPNFDRTVVLLVAHETGGALGVVLNRATEVPVAEVLGAWGELAGDPAVLF
jgi:putative transcriptional regulator